VAALHRLQRVTQVLMLWADTPNSRASSVGARPACINSTNCCL